MQKINDRLKLLLITGFSVLACTLAIYAFFNLEKEEKVIDLGLSDEARNNPKLAAELFLKQSGIQAEGMRNFSLLNKLPPPTDTIVITGNRESLSEYKYQKLTNWIERGGSLVLTIQTLYDEETGTSGDRFLDDLGVRQYMTETDSEDQEETSDTSEEDKKSDDYKKPDDNNKLEEIPDIQVELQKLIYNPVIPSCEEPGSEDGLTTTTFQGAEKKLQLDFSTRFAMKDAWSQAFSSAESSYGTHMLQYSIGDGILTVLTDDWIWDNMNICRWDHAYFLWLLTYGSEKVWFLYQTDSPSLPNLMIKHLHILIVSLCALAIILVLKYGSRFGPLIQSEKTERRQLREHIEARGRFYWNFKPRTELLDDLRQEVQRKVSLRHPDFKQEESDNDQ